MSVLFAPALHVVPFCKLGEEMESHLHRQRTLGRLDGSLRQGRYGKREGCISSNLDEFLGSSFSTLVSLPSGTSLCRVWRAGGRSS